MAENKKHKHICPKIDPSWNAKLSGPAYTPGMSAAEGRSAWYRWLRTLDTQAGCMPRKTSD